ncbi:MAG: ABC transporter permease subunit [Acidimicrobiia bacterium]|nr:ABC transporter permease subunit [Acidimicrobiia bacterium]
MDRRPERDSPNGSGMDLEEQGSLDGDGAGFGVAIPDQRSALRQLGGQIYRAGRPLIAIFVIWEIIGRAFGMSPLLLPRLADIADAFASGITSGILFQHIGLTLFRLFTGFAIGGTVGIVMGIISGRVKAVADWTVPLAALFLPIPSLAFAPLLILWFGLGNFPVIVLVALASSMPVFMNCYTGTLTVDPVQVNAAQSMGASGRSLFWKVILPGSLPHVLGGIRVGFARGWRAVIAGEFIAASGFGLGWFIFTSKNFLQTANVLVGIILIGVVGLLVEKILWERIERKTVVKWGMVENVDRRARQRI